MDRFRFHLSTAIVVMLLAALLLYANVRPQRIPRVKQMWTEVGAQAPPLEKSYLECFLHIQHGWPFAFHATQQTLDNRSIAVRSYNPDQDERYVSDVPRSEHELNSFRATGWSGAWQEFKWNQRHDLHSRRPDFVSYGAHLWNAGSLLTDLIIAGLVLLAAALAFEHFVARRPSRGDGTASGDDNAVSSGRAPGTY